jgi:hypothetical protein
MRKWLIIVLAGFLVIGISLCTNPVAYADDPPNGDPDMTVDIGVTGDVKVDISASGPADLKVGVEGPAQVSIDAGDEVKLNVKASDESQVLIEGQGVDEPNRQQETEYENPTTDLNSGSLQPNDPIVGSGNRVTIMLAASAIAAGLVAFFLIGRFVYRKRSERKIK